MSIKNQQSKPNGFTLIELLISLSIIGILLSMITPKFMGIKNKSKEAVIKSITHATQISLESYFLTENTYPNTDYKLSELVQELNAKGITIPNPKNPFTGDPYTLSDSSGQITYDWNPDQERYTLSGFGVNNSEEIVSVSN